MTQIFWLNAGSSSKPVYGVKLYIRVQMQTAPSGRKTVFCYPSARFVWLLVTILRHEKNLIVFNYVILDVICILLFLFIRTRDLMHAWITSASYLLTFRYTYYYLSYLEIFDKSAVVWKRYLQSSAQKSYSPTLFRKICKSTISYVYLSIVVNLLFSVNELHSVAKLTESPRFLECFILYWLLETWF